MTDILVIETILVGIETAGVLAILIIEVINLRDLRGQRRIGKTGATVEDPS